MLVHCNPPTAGQETHMDRIRFVTQGDQRILLLDFTNCTAQEVSAIADQAPAIVAQEPSGSVLVVADFSGAEFSRNAVEHIKFATVFDRAYIKSCLLYTSDAADEEDSVDLGGRRI